MSKFDSSQPPQPIQSGLRSTFGFERWRRRRVTIRIAVSLEFQENGEIIRIPAQTLSVSDEEATLLASQEVPASARVDLRQEFTGQRQSAHLTQAPVKREEGFHTSIRFDAPEPGFWHIIFPSTRF